MTCYYYQVIIKSIQYTAIISKLNNEQNTPNSFLLSQCTEQRGMYSRCGTDKVREVKEDHHRRHHQHLKWTLQYNVIMTTSNRLLCPHVLSSLSVSSQRLPRAPDTAQNLTREPVSDGLDPRLRHLLYSIINSSNCILKFINNNCHKVSQSRNCSLNICSSHSCITSQT